MANEKRVYTFGNGEAEGRADMRNTLGGKGANLAEMNLIGVPVPPGFTITTDCCNEYYEVGKDKMVELLKSDVEKAINHVEGLMNSKFGDIENPLLVSVRSGARASMPGMMDTILNLGLNDNVVAGIIRKTGNARFAWDSYRRFVQMYGDVVLGMKPVNKEDIDPFEAIIEEVKEAKGVKLDNELEVADLQELVVKFKAAVKAQTGKDFPNDAYEQLWGAICAVFDSWMNDRAILYRKMEGIPAEWGTAVNVQAMVFGNMGSNSATGVAFSRNPATGENKFYGEWLINAQGEDVVAGIRTPNPLNEATKNDHNKHLDSLETAMPVVYNELDEIQKNLELHFKDMQDIEFTIQDGKLWMLQCRVGKRTGLAALNMAMDMLHEGLIDEKTAVMRVAPSQLDEILHPILDPKAEKNAEVVAKGLPAGPGGAVGKIVFTAEDAVAAQQRGEKVILVREETNPEDVEGMRAADGLLTARGGMTSHAALVARGWGKCCIVGCDALHIIMNGAERALKIGDKTYKEGDVFSLNGSKGLVYDTAIETMDASENERFIEYMNIVDKYRVLGVRTNAENPQDAQNAINMGAEGIGLFRIEHMFYGANSEQPLAKLRKMILSSNTEERVAALDELRPFVIEAVRETMRVMDGKSVTFRLLDPPLHEFVPHTAEKQQELADEFGISVEDVRKRGESLQETNPMMGHRGVRLGISFPEISKMQFNAIFTATAQLLKEGLNPRPEIMVPVTVSVNELDFQKRLCEEVRAEVEKAEGVKIDYLYGTMIEIPRAAITADQMAKTAQFFSFGTNDLTQMTFGFSRDDIGGFMKDYLDNKILPGDPFQTIDRESVGALIETGVTKGRSTNENLKIGICGEHGGDPDSVEFCHLIGMNYVSCSPFRVPIARLAAAQAAIRFPKK